VKTKWKRPLSVCIDLLSHVIICVFFCEMPARSEKSGFPQSVCICWLSICAQFFQIKRLFLSATGNYFSTCMWKFNLILRQFLGSAMECILDVPFEGNFFFYLTSFFVLVELLATLKFDVFLWRCVRAIAIHSFKCKIFYF